MKSKVSLHASTCCRHDSCDSQRTVSCRPRDGEHAQVRRGWQHWQITDRWSFRWREDPPSQILSQIITDACHSHIGFSRGSRAGKQARHKRRDPLPHLNHGGFLALWKPPRLRSKRTPASANQESRSTFKLETEALGHFLHSEVSISE